MAGGGGAQTVIMYWQSGLINTAASLQSCNMHTGTDTQTARQNYLSTSIAFHEDGDKDNVIMSIVIHDMYLN